MIDTSSSFSTPATIFNSTIAMMTSSHIQQTPDVLESANELFRLYLFPPSSVLTGQISTSSSSSSSVAMASSGDGVAPSSSATSASSFSAIFQGPRGGFVIVDIFTSVLALISNCLIMAAVVRTKLSLSGYRRFLLSLAAADIVMASTTIMTFVHQNFAERYRLSMLEKCGNNLLRSLTLLGYFSSLLSIGGLTADNFLGIFAPLRYHQIMGGRKTMIAIVCLWILSIVLSFIDMPITAVVFMTRVQNGSPSPSPLAASNAGLATTTLAPTEDYGAEDYFTTTLSPPTTTTMTTAPTTTTTTTTTIVKKVKGKSSKKPSLAFANKSTMRASRVTKPKLIITSPKPTMAAPGTTADLQLHQIIHDILQFVEVEQEPEDWCSFYSTNKFGVEFFVIGLTIPCFILLLFIYGRIFYEVMTRPSAERNTKRLVLTTLLLIGSFTFCWMPFVTFELLMLVRARISAPVSGHAADNAGSVGPGENSGGAGSAENTQMLIINCFFNSLLMLSPLTNPIIYAARLSVVRSQLLGIITCSGSNVSVDGDTSAMPISARPSMSGATWQTYQNGTSNGFRSPSAHRTQSAIARNTYTGAPSNFKKASMMSDTTYNSHQNSSSKSSVATRSFSLHPSLDGVRTSVVDSPTTHADGGDAMMPTEGGASDSETNNCRQYPIMEVDDCGTEEPLLIGNDANIDDKMK